MTIPFATKIPSWKLEKEEEEPRYPESIRRINLWVVLYRRSKTAGGRDGWGNGRRSVRDQFLSPLSCKLPTISLYFLFSHCTYWLSTCLLQVYQWIILCSTNSLCCVTHGVSKKKLRDRKITDLFCCRPLLALLLRNNKDRKR